MLKQSSQPESIGKPRVNFVEYLRSIFGNDEQINSLGDLRRTLEDQLRTSSDISKTDVDYYYETLTGIKKRKILTSPTAGTKHEPGEEEETKGVTVPSTVSFLEKCKKIGKLGPGVCKMNLKDAFGSWVSKGLSLSFFVLIDRPFRKDPENNAWVDDEGLEIQCRSPFGSIRANTCVFSGAWYYEVRLLTKGLMQIGWATLQTRFTPEEGVGDTSDSFAYDGKRVMKWGNGRQPYGEAWEVGDIIGCYIDLNKREVSFARNGRDLGVAFRGISVGENVAYFPAVTMEQGQKVQVNFGRRASLNTNPYYWNVNACESESKGIHEFVSGTLLEAFKRVLTENKGMGTEITEDDKQLVACLLWEFIFPAMKYDLVMEKTILPFLIQLSAFHDMNYFDFAVNSLLNYCSPDELKFCVTSMFRIISENNLSYFYMDDDKTRDSFRLFPLALRLLRYPMILGTWLQSESIFTHLEDLFFAHLPSKTDLEKAFPYVYYPNTIFQTSSKPVFNKNMTALCAKCQTNEEAVIELTRLLMSDTAAVCANGSQVVPRLVMVNFLDHLIKKNVKYIQEFPGSRTDLSYPPVIANVVFSVLSYLEPTVLSGMPKHYPFPILYRADEWPEFVKLDRMGGILSHLLSVYETERNTTFKAMSEAPITAPAVFQFSLFNKAIILFNYVVVNEFNAAVRGFERYIQLSREAEEQPDEKRMKNKTLREEDIRSGLMQGIPYQHYLFTATNIKVMHKLAWYILELCNYIDQKCPELFYFVPDYYNATAFNIVKAFIRMDVGSLEFLWPKGTPSPISFPKDALIDSFITFVSNHLADKRIPNPDQQESFLVKLGILLQYKDIMTRLESHPVAKAKLLPSFLAAFEMKSAHILARNFLRLLKRGVYNDLAYTVLPDIGSEYYRKQFVELCNNDIKLREAFLNTFLNHVNNSLSEIKLHYAESGNISVTSREREEHRKEARNVYNVLYDMLRVLETTVGLIPLVFLESNGIFKQRTSDVCMLVIREAIQGQLGKFLNEIPTEDRKKTESLQMLLSPVAGVYLGLYAVLAQQKANKEKYVPIEEYIVRSDGYETKLMKNFVEAIKGDPKKVNPKSFFTIVGIVNTLDGFIEKHFSPDKTAKISEELLCPICYINPIDTSIVPCDHCIFLGRLQSNWGTRKIIDDKIAMCEKCIVMHMLTNSRCPFCNVAIQKTVKKDTVQS